MGTRCGDVGNSIHSRTAFVVGLASNDCAVGLGILWATPATLTGDNRKQPVNLLWQNKQI